MPTPIETGNINYLPALDKVKYTQLDFDSIKQGIINYIKANYPTVQNDFFESNAGIMLIDLIAWQNDTLALRADFLANEAYLPTAATNRSVRLLLSYINYYPAGSAGSVGTVRITLTDGDPGLFTAGSLTRDVVISTKDNPYKVSIVDNAGNSLTYEIFKSATDRDSSVIFPAGSIIGDYITATIVEGITQVQNVQLPNSISQNFTITMPNNNIIGNEIILTINGVSWRETDNFAYENGPTNTFEVRRTDNDQYQVVFGDGVFGAIPPSSGLVIMSYRTGGGTVGNVALGTMNTVQSVNTEGNLPVTFQFYNDTATTGGQDEENLEFSKKMAPKNFAAQLRTVTGEDYTVYAIGYKDGTNGSISKALSIIRPYLAAYGRNAGPYTITSSNCKIKVRVDDVYRTITLDTGTTITLDQLIDDFNTKAAALFTDPLQVDIEAFPYPATIYKIIGTATAGTADVTLTSKNMLIKYNANQWPISLLVANGRTYQEIVDEINFQIDSGANAGLYLFRANLNTAGQIEFIAVRAYDPSIDLFQIGAATDSAYSLLGFSTGQQPSANNGFKFAMGLNYHQPSAAFEVIEIADNAYSTIGVDFSVGGNGIGRSFPMAANYVDIYVLAMGPGQLVTTASQGLKDALQNFINRFKVLTDQITIVDGSIKKLTFTIDLYVNTAYNIATVKNSVTAFLNVYTSGILFNFNDPMYISKIYELIESIDGVDHVVIADILENGISQLTTGDGQIRDVYTKFNEVWTRDQITINAVYA